MMSLSKIFRINLGLAALFVLAHAPILLMWWLGIGNIREPWLVWLSAVLLPLDLLLLASSGIALLRDPESRSVLRLQASVLGAFAVGIAGLLFHVLVFGVPDGWRFSWSPGLGAVFCGYAAYLIRRAFFVGEGEDIGNHHRYVGAVVGAGEAALMVRLLAEIVS